MAQPNPKSPVLDVTRRSLNPSVRLLLCVETAGRCEFDGCNRYLFEHPVTLGQGAFGQIAHIVAFREKGPRGNHGTRPANINDIQNLMLMCPACHKLVDDRPSEYTRETLAAYKRAHEKRITHLTSFGPDRTAVLVVKAPIGGQTVAVPFSQVVAAMAPRYPVSRDFLEIDLTQLADSGRGFLAAAAETIRTRVARFFEPGGDVAKAQHVSVFAIAPMPLLVFLGRQLSNKVPADVYQRHRGSEDWSWKGTGSPVKYTFRQRRTSKKGRVALVLSLSGTVPMRALPAAVRQSSSIYEITLRGRTPNPTFLRRREDLQAFAIEYQQALATITAHHGLVRSIDLFPAVPAPIALLCGREVLPKVHPKLRVFDYDQTKGGFTFILEV